MTDVAPDNSARVSRARVAAAARWADRKTANDIRRDHKAMMLDRHITNVVNAWPPLRADQLARLRMLLTPAPAGTCPVAEERAA